MIRLALALAALLLCACPAPRALTTTLIVRPSEATNTTQPCLSAPELAPLADLSLVLLAREAMRDGHSYEAIVSALAAHRPSVCLVAAPEPCCQGRLCQVDSDGQTRGKAGCTVDGQAVWVSRTWPPSPGYDWGPTLCHELGHVVAAQLGVPETRDHQTRWATVVERAVTALARVRLGES